MDLTVINEVWRPVYGELVQGLRLLTPEWAALEKLENFEQLSPRAINWPVDLRFGGGIAATEDGGSLARAVSNSPVEATDTWKHFTGRFEVGFDELDAEGDSKFARQEIEKQIRYQARDKLRAFRRAVAMMFYGKSTGVLFHVDTVDDANDEFTVNNFYGVSGLAVPDRLRDYIQPGTDYIAIHDTSSGDSELVRGLVGSVDDSTNTISFDSAQDLSSVASGDKVVLANQVITGEGSDLDRWMNGLLDLTRATTLHGISSANQPDWTAGVDQSSYGQALSGQDMYQFFETIEQRSDMPVEWAWTTVGVIAAAGGAELDQRRYGSEEDTMRLGFQKLNVMGTQVSGRPYCPSGHFFMGSNSALRKLSPDEGAPEPQNVVETGEKAGSFQQYTDRLGFYKDQLFRAQLTAVSRLGLGVLDGVTEA